MIKQQNHKKIREISVVNVLRFVFAIITVATGLIGIVYFVWSLIIIFQQTTISSLATIILNILSLVVETTGISYTVYLFAEMTGACYKSKTEGSVTRLNNDTLPSVSIFIPIHNPNIEVLKETVTALNKINYPQNSIEVYFGDDTLYNNMEKQSAIKSLISQFKFHYCYNPENIYFKAGMLNLLWKNVKSKYVVLLDYDHIINPDFVLKSVLILEQNPELAFVQAKVNFRDVRKKIQVWESVMYAQFFEVFQRAKNRRKIVITNGSTLCLRKDVVEKIGGVPIDSFTDDVNLSIDLLTSGYKSCLLDEYGSFGLVPEDFKIVLAQLLRWSKGSLISLKRRFIRIVKSDLPLLDKIDLLFNITVFLISASIYIVIFLYVLMFLVKAPIIRVTASSFPPLLFLPIVLSVSYQLSGVLAIYFGRKEGLKSLNYVELIYFYLIALILNPFTIYAVIKSLFYRRIPNRLKDEWNSDVPLFRLSGLVSILGLLLLSIAIIDFLRKGSLWLILGLLSFSMIATFPLCLFLYLSTKNNKTYSDLDI